MSLRVRANFIRGTLGSTLPLASSGDSGPFSSANLQELPAVAAPYIAAITIDPDEVFGPPEIVWVIAHGSGSSSSTILRGQEGTVPRQHLLSNQVEWRHLSTVDDWLAVDLFNAGNLSALPAAGVPGMKYLATDPTPRRVFFDDGTAQREIIFGNNTGLQLNAAAHFTSGSGSPDGRDTGTAGDYYFRTDTPSTANQRIYVCAGGTVWTGIA